MTSNYLYCTSKAMKVGTQIFLRPSRGKGEERIFAYIRREAWKSACHHIYEDGHTRRHFGGLETEGRTWPSIECMNDETLAACTNIDTDEEQICGYAKWGWTPKPRGGLNSLYVAPKYWNCGCGALLWNDIISTCHRDSVKTLDIWVLEKARSGEFYSPRGCHKVDSGGYFVGSQRETALCCRWSNELLS